MQCVDLNFVVTSSKLFTVQFWGFTSTVTSFVVNKKDLAMYIRLSSGECFSKFKAAPKGNIDFEQ